MWQDFQTPKDKTSLGVQVLCENCRLRQCHKCQDWKTLTQFTNRDPRRLCQKCTLATDFRLLGASETKLASRERAQQAALRYATEADRRKVNETLAIERQNLSRRRQQLETRSSELRQHATPPIQGQNVAEPSSSGTWRRTGA